MLSSSGKLVSRYSSTTSWYQDSSIEILSKLNKIIEGRLVLVHNRLLPEKPRCLIHSVETTCFLGETSSVEQRPKWRVHRQNCLPITKHKVIFIRSTDNYGPVPKYSKGIFQDPRLRNESVRRASEVNLKCFAEISMYKVWKLLLRGEIMCKHVSYPMTWFDILLNNDMWKSSIWYGTYLFIFVQFRNLTKKGFCFGTEKADPVENGGLYTTILNR